MAKIILMALLTLTSSVGSALATVECWDGSCLKKGWTHKSSTSQFTDYMCREDNCFTNGWIAGGNEGVSIYTQCKDGACFKNGWYEIDRSSQKLLLNVTCRKGDCLKHSWDGYSDQGQSFSECNKLNCGSEGWVTSGPGFKHIYTVCQGTGCYSTGWVESTY